MYLEAVTFITWSGKQVWNACDSISTSQRSAHAQTLLASKYEKLFSADCRFRSLLSRLNRCSREYSNSLFSNIPGLRVSGYPAVRFDMSALSSVVRGSFNGSWGDENGVDPELYFTCRDALLDKFNSTTKVPDYQPKPDCLRVLIGGEFQHRFARGKREKRVRESSPRSSASKGNFT